MKPLSLLAAAVLLALLTACGDGGGEPAPAAATKGTFELPTETPPETQEPVLELSYEGGLIKNPDPTPFVRVYPDGRVLVHYPAYMKRAGDYELRLSDDELRDLLASFADGEVLTMEEEGFRTMAARALAEEGPVERSDDHGVTTVVEIRAESFTPDGADEPMLLDVERTLRIDDMPPEDLAAEAGFRPVMAVAGGVRRLEALAERDDLQPVGGSESEEEGQ